MEAKTLKMKIIIIRNIRKIHQTLSTFRSVENIPVDSGIKFFGDDKR